MEDVPYSEAPPEALTFPLSTKESHGDVLAGTGLLSYRHRSLETKKRIE
jgi:hypothetical protein